MRKKRPVSKPVVIRVVVSPPPRPTKSTYRSKKRRSW